MRPVLVHGIGQTNFPFSNFNFHFSKNKLPFLQLQLPFFKKQTSIFTTSTSIFQKINFHFYNFNFHLLKNKLPFLQLQLPFFKKQTSIFTTSTSIFQNTNFHFYNFNFHFSKQTNFHFYNFNFHFSRKQTSIFTTSTSIFQKKTSILQLQLPFFIKFNGPLKLPYKSHDRTRIRDSLCQCGVTRAGQYRGHLSFHLFLYAMSLDYLCSIRILKIRLFTVWSVFLLYCCFFGWQGRRHNMLFHTVFDVILVKLNEWIPVLLKCR